MRIALLSDIHANIHALQAVGKDVEGQRIDETWSLGDAVGYGGHPKEALAWVEAQAHLTLKGNHDEAVATGQMQWFNPMAAAAARCHAQLLTPPERARIYGWPERHEREIDDAKILAVHASPDDPLHEYVQPQDARFSLRRWEGRARVILLGHTHRPFVARLEASEKDAWSGLHFLEAFRETRDVREPLLIVNPGSVGQPRDSDPRASYAILDTHARTVELRRVAYDIESAAQAILKQGLDPLLALRLYEGR